MIAVFVKQGTPEWEQERIGIPTASCFDRILTPKKLEPSKDAVKYRNEILAEWLLGHSIDFTGSNAFMDRGTGMEEEARNYYEMKYEVDVDTVGLVLRDDSKVGGSPDGLVGEHGGVEIKCPAIQTHIGYMLDPETLADKYRSQVQGYLYLTGRQWWDIVSYNPVLPGVVVRILPDAKYAAALGSALDAFVANLDECKELLKWYKDTAAAPEVLANIGEVIA